MIILKKKQDENFIDVERERGIQYTENDVNFYNEYLGDFFRIREFKNTVIHLLFAICALNINTYATYLKDSSSLIALFLLISVFFFHLYVIYFSFKEYINIKRKKEKIKNLGDTSFNFHYFLEQNLIERLNVSKKEVNKEILNSVIKLYPEKEKISNLFKKNTNNVNKTIKNIYTQYLNILKYNKENP